MNHKLIRKQVKGNRRKNISIRRIKRIRKIRKRRSIKKTKRGKERKKSKMNRQELIGRKAK